MIVCVRSFLEEQSWSQAHKIQNQFLIFQVQCLDVCKCVSLEFFNKAARASA